MNVDYCFTEFTQRKRCNYIIQHRKKVIPCSADKNLSIYSDNKGVHCGSRVFLYITPRTCLNIERKRKIQVLDIAMFYVNVVIGRKFFNPIVKIVCFRLCVFRNLVSVRHRKGRNRLLRLLCFGLHTPFRLPPSSYSPSHRRKKKNRQFLPS